MNVYEIESWCREGNGGTIGRTLLLPLSAPQVWEPAALPPELSDQKPLPGHALRAARKVFNLLGMPIAVGFALLAARPEEPFAHVFNVRGGKAVDLSLVGHDVLGYWAYLPTPEQLALDGRSLALEAPRPSDLPRLRRQAG